jgi:hypothetical protein
MITLHATIHDSLVTLLRNAFLCDGGVHPVGEAPLLCGYLTPLNRCACVVQNSVLKGLVEDAVVQEDIGVVKPPVEMSFDRLDRLYDTIQLFVSREDYEGGVRSGCVDLRLETSYRERLVILFANFSGKPLVSGDSQC